MTREDVLTALFDLLVASGEFRTTGRRLIFWSQCDAQPALFLRHMGDDYLPRQTRMPARVVMSCEVWLYTKGDADGRIAPGAALTPLIEAVESALLPPSPALEAQTLGGLVVHCWIEGRIDVHPGDLDGQAIAVIPVRILVPSFGG